MADPNNISLEEVVRLNRTNEKWEREEAMALAENRKSLLAVAAINGWTEEQVSQYRMMSLLNACANYLAVIKQGEFTLKIPVTEVKPPEEPWRG